MALLTAFPLRRPPQALLPLQLPLLPPHPRLRLLLLPLRPLLRLPGVAVSRVPCDAEGFADLDALPGLFRENTRLVIMAHGSNVCGAVQDAAAIGRICAEKGVPFALDAAQTAGHLPVDFQAFGLSAMAVPGHKGLLGPGGVGALLLRQGVPKINI